MISGVKNLAWVNAAFPEGAQSVPCRKFLLQATYVDQEKQRIMFLQTCVESPVKERNRLIIGGEEVQL